LTKLTPFHKPKPKIVCALHQYELCHWLIGQLWGGKTHF